MSEPPGDGADYAARRDAALGRLADGDADGAFHEFRWSLWYRSGEHIEPERLAEALGVLARIVVAMGHRELAELCARVSTDVQDPDALYELGYQLIEIGLPAIAVTVLRRCLDVVPGSEQVITELVAALERMLLYPDARVILAAHPRLVEDSFLCRYLYAYDSAMSGDLTTTRALAPGLTPTDDTQRFMAARITQILERAERAALVTSLDDRDLRGWHYVLTGGLLLHRSAHGFDDAMRGRYAWLQDNHAQVRTGLDRLRVTLARWEVTPLCVYAPPGRDHEIVAEAAARMLGVERVPWPAVGIPAPGLVVAYDLAQVPWRDLERLVERRAGQVLFAHASLWTEDGPVAPDVTTLLYQSLVPPWGARLMVDGAPGAGPARPAPPDDRPVEAIADEVLAASGLGGDDLAHDDLVGLDALITAAGPPGPGRRERLWAGSPVSSNRFL